MAGGVKIEGLDNAVDVLDSIPLLAADVIGDAVEKGGEVVRDRAKELAPVNTGRLRENIIVEDAEKIGAFGARTKVGHNGNAWYGIFPELGTGRGFSGNPHPFLRPAADEKWREAAEIIADEIRDSIL